MKLTGIRPGGIRPGWSGLCRLVASYQLNSPSTKLIKVVEVRGLPIFQVTVAGDLSGVSEEEQKQTTGWRIKSCSKEIPIKKVFLQLTCLDKITPGLTYLATYVEQRKECKSNKNRMKHCIPKAGLELIHATKAEVNSK